MKRFEPVTGGHRFRLDDLMLMQEAYKESIKGALSAFNNSHYCILSGCSLSTVGNTFNLTEGYISFNGEVLKVEAVTINKLPLPDRLFLKINEIIEPPSPVLYRDLTNKTVHFNRLIVVKYFNLSDGDDNFVNGVYYDSLFPASTIPKGSVIEFYPSYLGEENEVFDASGVGILRMKGYALCNGLNNTPDLRGSFTLMPSSNVFNAAPLIGRVDGILRNMRIGLKEINILKANLPDYTLRITDPGHTHQLNDFYYDGPNQGNNSPSLKGDASDNSFTRMITNSKTTGIIVNLDGGGQAISNIPPAVGMLKIIRL